MLAESIHEKNDRAVLRGMGLEPRPPLIEDVTVGTTRENLEGPIKGERNEQENLYPAMISVAGASRANAGRGEELHVRDEHGGRARHAVRRCARQPRAHAPVDYYVGTVSGDTVTRPTGREPYTKVE